ncbi:hypothetical protein K437DRAFT_260020 [Tilletiaria anomala UBC 951]|uniref:Uncharacterized protein n=1 Tax=Tilletiaria anomala (strain ATCC 24038 / CBS 436.72 / UBC 951) TaxID=1037660 RepID=A0A066VDF9_TILAU|nr:uncharacterized protein K437DRAFT_260020 [Tilletiaria anomala UBC 951]KDN36789.1 hypothetical protein K437DRAFT_260020 [Tilletiaria anomala UBC 951]
MALPPTSLLFREGGRPVIGIIVTTVPHSRQLRPSRQPGLAIRDLRSFPVKFHVPGPRSVGVVTIFLTARKVTEDDQLVRARLLVEDVEHTVLAQQGDAPSLARQAVMPCGDFVKVIGPIAKPFPFALDRKGNRTLPQRLAVRVNSLWKPSRKDWT